MKQPLWNWLGIPYSKSLLNRALIVKSLCPNWTLEAKSEAKDVFFLSKSLDDWKRGEKHFYVGQGGTTFRFLVTFLMRHGGYYKIELDPQLARRPHKELEQLAVAWNAKLKFQSLCVLELEAPGWSRCFEGSFLFFHKTSQVATACLLVSLNWSKNLIWSVAPEHLKWIRYSYFDLTLKFLAQIGINIQVQFLGDKAHIFVPANSCPEGKNYQVEVDWSSAAALMCLGRLLPHGVCFTNIEKISSIQPDSSILKLVCPWSFSSLEKKLIIEGLNKLRPFNWDFTQTPDLLPVLGVKATITQGVSYLSGFDHVESKETDRLTKLLSFYNEHQIKYRWENKRLAVSGIGIEGWWHQSPKTLETWGDHRWAMAFALIMKINPAFKLAEPEVVEKSFPNFWDFVNLTL